MKVESGIVYFDILKQKEKEGKYLYILNEQDKKKADSLFSLINFEELNFEYILNPSSHPIEYFTRVKTSNNDYDVHFYDDNAPVSYENFIKYFRDLSLKKLKKVDTIIEISTKHGVYRDFKPPDFSKFPPPPPPPKD